MPSGSLWGWHDPDRRKPLVNKIIEGVDAYEKRFKQPPRHLVLNPETYDALVAEIQDGKKLPRMKLRIEAGVAPKNTHYYVCPESNP